MEIKNTDIADIMYMLKRISNLDVNKGYTADGMELSPTEYAGNLADEILKLINQNSAVQIPETPSKTINWDSDVARRNFNDVFNLAQPLIEFDVRSTRGIMCGSTSALTEHTENELYQRFSEVLYSCFENYSLSDALPLDVTYSNRARDWILKMIHDAHVNE